VQLRSRHLLHPVKSALFSNKITQHPIRLKSDTIKNDIIPLRLANIIKHRGPFDTLPCAVCRKSNVLAIGAEDRRAVQNCIANPSLLAIENHKLLSTSAGAINQPLAVWAEMK
jgi:hypothetical protein